MVDLYKKLSGVGKIELSKTCLMSFPCHVNLSLFYPKWGMISVVVMLLRVKYLYLFLTWLLNPIIKSF